LSKAHCNPISAGYGWLSSTISMTLKFTTLCTPSIFIGIPVNQPIGTILCWFSNLNWLGYYINLGFPIISHVFFGNRFTLNPRSKMTLSTPYSPTYILNMNSLLVLFLRSTCFTTLRVAGISIYYVKWSFISHNAFITISFFIISMQLLINSLRVLTFSIDFSGIVWSHTRGAYDVDAT